MVVEELLRLSGDSRRQDRTPGQLKEEAEGQEPVFFFESPQGSVIKFKPRSTPASLLVAGFEFKKAIF